MHTYVNQLHVRINASYTIELVLPEGCGTPSYGQYKTQTALLLKRKDSAEYQPFSVVPDPDMLEVVAFGDAAEKAFAQIPIEERDNYCFCKWFKMLLHSSKSGDSDPEICSGEEGALKVTLSVAIAKTLQVFRDEALRYLARSHLSAAYSAADVVWILTVPAIWSDKSKYLMRCAAVTSGLIDSFDSDNLIICLETEGVCFAALFDGSDSGYIRDDYVDEESKSGYFVKDVFSKRGNTFLIVDAGGGTVDFGGYEVMQTHPFKVKQIIPPSGGAYGSTQVDRCFLDFIYTLIGEEAAFSLQEKLYVQYELLQAWESVKVNAVPGQRTLINLSSLHAELLSPMGLNLRSLVQRYQETNDVSLIALKGETRLELSAECTARIFGTSVSLILTAMEKCFERAKNNGFQFIIMAGGYSQSAYVSTAIHDKFHHRVKHIFLVPRPDTAIVRGASIYGTAHKSLVTHRVSRLTYGIRDLTRFNSADSEHNLRIGNITRDDHDVAYIPTFAVIVREGLEIPSGYTSEPRLFSPLLASQESMRIHVISSPSAKVRFPDENGVVGIAHFDVPLNMDVPFDDRCVSVEVNLYIL